VASNLRLSTLAHPDIPRDRPGFVITDRAARHPLFLWYVPGELGSILEDEHKPHIVDVREYSATDGLLSIALASSPPSGRARSRLSRMALLRSQESSRASSRC